MVVIAIHIVNALGLAAFLVIFGYPELGVLSWSITAGLAMVCAFLHEISSRLQRSDDEASDGS